MLGIVKKVWQDQQKEQTDLPDMSACASGGEKHLPSGARYFCYWPQAPIQGWVLSLHGGPESYEGREVRYGGLYRALLEQGVGIVVLNYRGSKCQSDILGSSADVWGRWRESIVEDAFELFSFLPKKVQHKPMLILGGSFGGSLALLLAQTIGAEGVVLFSPLLDLKEQILRAGRHYASWFRQRFSTDDVGHISLNKIAKGISCPVLMAFGSQDEVLGSRVNRLFLKKMKQEKNWRFLVQKCKHAPQSYREYKQRYLSAFQFICAVVGT